MRVYTHAIYGQSPSPPTTPAALPRQAQEASCYGALPYLYPAGFPGKPIAAGHTSLLCCILFESLVVVFTCFLAIFIDGCVICCICWPLSCFLGAVLLWDLRGILVRWGQATFKAVSAVDMTPLGPQINLLKRKRDWDGPC